MSRFRKVGYSLLLMAVGGTLHADVLLTEHFDNIANLAGSGWVMVNNSSPLGLTGWYQGNPAVFPALSGADDSYIAANFDNAAFGGTISNWLISPVLHVVGNAALSFYTRTEMGAVAADRLEVRFSANGASTNVGTTASSVGDFTTLALLVNPGLTLSGYPDSWTQYYVSFGSAGATMDGRLAFRYSVPDTSINADYIGIDDVRVWTPEPASITLMALALAVLARRRGSRG